MFMEIIYLIVQCVKCLDFTKNWTSLLFWDVTDENKITLSSLPMYYAHKHYTQVYHIK